MPEDRAVLMEHLAQAEKNVALGAKHVARQKEMIEELACGGYDTSRLGLVDPTITVPAHAGFEAICLAEAAPGIAVLRSLIGMDYGLPCPPSAHSFDHCVQHKFPVKGRCDSPANDLAREKIHNDGQTEPPSQVRT